MVRRSIDQVVHAGRPLATIDPPGSQHARELVQVLQSHYIFESSTHFGTDGKERASVRKSGDYGFIVIVVVVVVIDFHWCG